jgi:hypothetical protein
VRILSVALAGLVAAVGVHAQTVDAATRARVIDGALREIENSYVDASAGARIKAALARDRHALDETTSAQAFADQLSERIHSAVPDRHLHVEYSPEPLQLGALSEAERERNRQRDREAGERSNFGFERVERLPGNIGYIDLRRFSNPAWAGDTLAAAMTLVAHSDALIIDLRENTGGYPATAALLESYLFDGRTHTVDIYWRDGDRTEQFWTQDSVSGSRFGQSKPVWLLTSTRTFSGAEGFAFDLKNLKRATVVGETTGGGANPGKFVALDEHFGLFVPTGRAVSPVTHGNWEGTGVEPDVKVEARLALATAQRLALEHLIAGAPNAASRTVLHKQLDALR